MGRPAGPGDARHHDATLATRNTRDFDSTGIGIVDPWHAD
jgi:predicted nucleic acid-binding protein